MKSIIYIFIFNCIIINSSAQEMWGISNSNYAGQMGMDLNPATMVAAQYRWELHVISADAFAMNNYMLIKRKSRVIKKSFSGESVDQDRVVDNYSVKNKFGNGSAFAKYPAFIYSGKKTAFAFHVATRLALSVRGMPYHLAKFMKEGFDYAPQQNIHYSGGNSEAVAINWHEAGISLGSVLKDDNSSYLTGAITLNYLYGLNSFYMRINSIDYSVPNDSLWQINIANVEYGHALADKGDNVLSDVLEKKGSGYSTTFGFQYYRNRNENAYLPCTKVNTEKKYDYKIGLSFIDIGKIKFDNKAAKYVFSDVSTNWYGIDTVKFNSIGNFDSLFNNQFFSNATAGKTADNYSVLLPGAASLQFDYSLTPSFYVNVSAIQRIPLGDYAVKRPNQISITVRYETRRFEVSIPYSLYDYYRNRIGFAVRYGVLIVGSDMIGPLTGISNIYGADFFAGIKWQYFGDCKRKITKHKSKKGKADDCFFY